MSNDIFGIKKLEAEQEQIFYKARQSFIDAFLGNDIELDVLEINDFIKQIAQLAKLELRIEMIKHDLNTKMEGAVVWTEDGKAYKIKEGQAIPLKLTTETKNECIEIGLIK